jgi:hypothetical protein
MYDDFLDENSEAIRREKTNNMSTPVKLSSDRFLPNKDMKKLSEKTDEVSDVNRINPIDRESRFVGKLNESFFSLEIDHNIRVKRVKPKNTPNFKLPIE